MKKIIAIILACALVLPNLTACSSEEISGVVQDVGLQVFDAVQNGEDVKSAFSGIVGGNEIESVVMDIVDAQLDGVAQVANSQLESLGALAGEKVEDIGDEVNVQIEIVAGQAGNMIDNVGAEAIGKLDKVEIPDEAVPIIESALDAIVAEAGGEQPVQMLVKVAASEAKKTVQTAQKGTQKETKKDTEKETVKETQKETEKETQKETVKETQKETEKETQKETVKETEAEQKAVKAAAAEKETQKETQKETKAEKETVKETVAEKEAEKGTEKETEKEVKKAAAKAAEAKKEDIKAAAEAETETEIAETTESEDEEPDAASEATASEATASEATASEATESELELSDDASGFVMVNEVADKIIQDMRYYSLYNGLKLRLPGYEQPALLLTKEAAEAVKDASDALYEKGYILKIFDAYRPKSAQDKLDEEGMGSILADNTRGSSVDVTLVDRKTGKELDMSECAYGFIDSEDLALTDKQKDNQKLLKKAMEAAGFEAGDEWYHFVLKDEPYKDTCFTFPINFRVAGKTAEEYRNSLTREKNKDRKLKCIIEFYDDGSVEINTTPDTDSDNPEE